MNSKPELRYTFYKKISKNGDKYFRVYDSKHDYFFDTSPHHLKNPSPYFINYEMKLHFKKYNYGLYNFIYNIHFPNEGKTIEFEKIHIDLLKFNEYGLCIGFGPFSCEFTLVDLPIATNISNEHPKLCVNSPNTFIKKTELFIQIKEQKCLTQDFNGRFGSCEYRFIPVHKFESYTKKIYNRYAELYNSITNS